MKQFYYLLKKHLCNLPFLFVLMLLLQCNGMTAQKKVFVLTKGDQISSTGATLDSALIDSLKARFQVRVWKYSANLVATDSASLDSAGVIVVTRNLSSGQLINTSTNAAWWSRRPVPIIFLPVQMVSNNRCKMINTGSTVVRSYTNNGYIRPKNLVIKANVLDNTDPAFKGLSITNNQVNYFNWIYETINMDSTVFVTTTNGNYGKLLLTASDPDTVSTNAKVLMIRWSPGDSTYRNSGIKVANYRTYLQIGTDVNAAFRHFNNFQAQSIQILANEIKYLCPDIATGMAKKLYSDNLEISAYPNPARNYITVKVNNHSAVSAVSIYNSNGKLVRTLSKGESLSNINISKLSPGIYFIKVIEGKKSVIKQFVKF